MNTSSPGLIFLLVAIATSVAFFSSCQLLFHYLFDVRLGATAVEFVILKRFAVWAIPRDEIIRFDKVSFWEAAFSWGFNLVSRPFGPYVLLHRDRGLIRRVIVTPRDAEEFCNAFRLQWASADGSATKA